MTTDQPDRPGTSFAVTPAAVELPASPADRSALEREVIDELTRRLTPGQRRFLEQSLSDRRAGKTESRAFQVQGDPEAARLFGTLYSLWDAEDKERMRATWRGLAFTHAAPATLALVDSFPAPDAVARVIRTAGSAGTNVLLFRRDALSPALVATALEILSRSRQEDGEIIERDYRVTLKRADRRPPLTAEARARVDELVAALQTAPEADVPGVGRVPAVSISVPPEGAGASS